MEEHLKEQVVQLSEDHTTSKGADNCAEFDQLFVDMSTESIVESILRSLSSLDRSQFSNMPSETSHQNKVGSLCILDAFTGTDCFQSSPKAIFLCGKNDDVVNQLVHDLLETFPTSFCRPRMCKTDALCGSEHVSGDTYIVSHDDMSKMMSKQEIVYVSTDASGSTIGICLEDVSSAPLTDNAIYLVPCHIPDIECVKSKASEGFKLVCVEETQARSSCFLQMLDLCCRKALATAMIRIFRQMRITLLENVMLALSARKSTV